MHPKVSILIPCYNSLEFLKDTLASVLDQSHPNIEVIIVDDGSTDGSLEYLVNIKDKNLIVVSNNGNGACAARNQGFELSTGKYVQFLDADDILGPDKIKKQVELLEKNPQCIAVCSTQQFYDNPENGKVTDTDFMLSTNNPAEFLLNLYGAKGSFEMVQTSAWLTPRMLIEKAGPWDEALSKDQDGEFFCRVVMTSKGVVFEPNVLNYYRKHPLGQNIANQNHRVHIESQFCALNSKAKILDSEKDTDAYKKAMALQYRFLAINAYPDYKDLSEKAMGISKKFGGSDYLPVLGGRLIEFLKFTFGWKFAKSFSHRIHNNGIFQKIWNQ